MTTLLDTGGDAIERYVYTPYGVLAIYHASWSNPCGASSYAVEYTYTGRRLDGETGLYYYRHRMYHAQLGRFCSRDPIRYASVHRLYTYANGRPLLLVDPSGLQAGCCGMEIGHMLDDLKTRAHSKFFLTVLRDPGSALLACMGKDIPFGWEINQLFSNDKYMFSRSGCGTSKCRGTVSVHGQCHWASDVNYFIWGLSNHLCSMVNWDEIGPGYNYWTEQYALNLVLAWRTVSWFVGDGTTRGRLAWTSAGYRCSTFVPAIRPDCPLCGKKANGTLTGYFGDFFYIYRSVIQF